MRRTLVLAAAAAVAAGFGGNALAAGGTTLSLKTDKIMLKYDKKALAAPAGSVTITLTNISPLQHNVAIKGPGVSKAGKVVGKGGTSTVTATLKKGTYTFYCTVPGHEAAGMKGVLVVK